MEEDNLDIENNEKDSIDEDKIIEDILNGVEAGDYIYSTMEYYGIFHCFCSRHSLGILFQYCL